MVCFWFGLVWFNMVEFGGVRRAHGRQRDAALERGLALACFGMFSGLILLLFFVFYLICFSKGVGWLLVGGEGGGEGD